MTKISTQSINTATDVDKLFESLENDVDRIKTKTKKFKNISIADAFSQNYGLKISDSIKTDELINEVVTLNVGQVYTGTVKKLDKCIIEFEVPGVKDNIICKENFNDCMDNVRSYLLSTENKLKFLVKEKSRDKIVVSVLDALYNDWKNQIIDAINNNKAINVHIDSLIKAGYLCHTEIFTLNAFTGRNYTSSVFIPGSHIVLNIERDFGRWVGESVFVVPQKFVKFKTAGRPAEDSLVASRKKVLEIEGMTNMFNLYHTPNASSLTMRGVVTGVINSNKKTGVFIEIEDKCITGLMNVDSADLLNYKPGDEVMVKVQSFETHDGKEPFVVDKEKSLIKKCNVRVVFELA